MANKVEKILRIILSVAALLVFAVATDSAEASRQLNEKPHRGIFFTDANLRLENGFVSADLRQGCSRYEYESASGDSLAPKTVRPSIGHSTPWDKMTQTQRNAFKHSYSRHGKELGLPNWSEENAAALQKQFNDVSGYIRQNGTQLPGPISKPWNGQSVEVNFFEAEFHGTKYYYYDDAASGTFISAGRAR